MKSWALALGVSFALHLVAVIALKPEAAAPTSAPQVEKRGDGFVSFTAVSLVPRQAAPAPAAPARPAVAPARVATRVVTAAAGAEPGGLPVAEVAQPEEGPSAPAAPAAEGPASEGGGETKVAAPPSGGGEGPTNEEVIALVRARLAAAEARCYPSAARRFQQRGTVQLSFCTDASGGTATTEITQSSGAELLDAAARGCVLESAVPFPREASGRCFSVPVRFGLPR